MKYIGLLIPVVLLFAAVYAACMAAYWKGRSDALKDWNKLLLPLFDYLEVPEPKKPEEKKDSESPVVH